MNKQQALARHLDLSLCEIEDIEDVGDNRFEIHGGEYLVLTDDEANEAAADYIKENIWSFNIEFLRSHCKIEINERVAKNLRDTQQELCESANDLFLSLIKDVEHFIDDAINADGRGHFLSCYDGEEHEAGEYFIYRC